MTDRDDRRTKHAESDNLMQSRSKSAIPVAHRHPEITLHQLRVFWTIARSETLTKAAKQLGLAQPSLSQQLSKLETIAGARLFDRRSNQMVLTEAGSALMPKAELVLRDMGEFEDSLSEYLGGTRTTIRLSGINSILCAILPAAMQLTLQRCPDIDFDIHENAPAEVLELLNTRRVSIGFVAANSLPQASAGYLQIPIIDDPYVLVVPGHLDLSHVRNLRQDMDHETLTIINRSIRFVFGTQHGKRTEDWHDQALPEHRIVAQCRSYDVAIELVRSGLGVCLAPALSAIAGTHTLDGVTLYRVDVPPRKLVAVLPSQYRRVEPYATFIDALREAGDRFSPPCILPIPPFLKKRLRKAR